MADPSIDVLDVDQLDWPGKYHGFIDDSSGDEEEQWLTRLSDDHPITKAEPVMAKFRGYESDTSSPTESEEDIDEGLFWWPDEARASNQSTSDASTPRTDQDSEGTPREISAESRDKSPDSGISSSESKPEGPIVDLPDELQLHCLSFLKLKHLLPLYGVSKQFVLVSRLRDPPSQRLTPSNPRSFRGLLAAEILEIDATTWPNRTVSRWGHFTAATFPYLVKLNIEGHTFESNWKCLSQLVSLRHLNLSRTCFSDEFAPLLRPLTALETLDLRYSIISDEALRFISGLTDLRVLQIRQAHVSDDVIALSDSGLEYLKDLRQLETLMYCQGRRAASTLLPHPAVFRGKGFAHLSQLTKLTSLDVSCCDLEMPHFQNVSTLQSLVKINVSWCPWLLPYDAKVFATLKNLKIVYCTGNSFTARDIAVVASIRPDITFDGTIPI